VILIPLRRFLTVEPHRHGRVVNVHSELHLAYSHVVSDSLMGDDWSSLVADKATESDRALGEVLAGARKAKGLTQGDVAKFLRTQAWVSRVENGTCRPSPNELEMLIRLYQPTAAQRELIDELRAPLPASARQGSRLDRNFLELRRLEQVAFETLVLVSERLPKHLQSDQYMLLQYQRAGSAINEADLFAERHTRQQVFIRNDKAPYRVILAESALYRMPGGNPDLVKEQASYLLNCIERFPDLRLQVLLFNADVPFIDADVVILRFTDQSKDRAFIPFGASAHELKGREVSHRIADWYSAQDAALNVDDSRKFIHNLSERGDRPSA
jgi:transcriptional regulator with XRE-family HTH domain